MAQGKIGNLTIVAGTAFKDAELKHVGSKDTALCEFSLIVGKKDDGKGIFANCKAWKNLGEYAAQMQKGDAVCVVGTIESREYNGKTYTDLKADWLNIAKAEPVLSPNGTPYPSCTKFADTGGGFSELDDGDGELPF